MSARSQALVPLSAEQQAAWRAVAETEKRRHQGNTLAEYPYAGAFFRCLNGSRRISLSDLRFFMPSLTAEELRGNRSQWLYAVDVLIETQGEVCLLPLPGALGMWNGSFFSQYPLTLNLLDPDFQMPVPVLAAQGALAAGGVGMLGLFLHPKYWN